MPFLLVTWVFWILLSSPMQLDGFRGGWRFPAVFSRILLAVCCLMAVSLSGGYLARRYVSRLALGYFGLLLLAGFITIRYGARLFIRIRRHSGAVRRIVIVGSGRVARELALKIDRHPEMLCEVVGFLCSEDAPVESDLVHTKTGPTVTVSTLDVIKLLQTRRVDELILVLPRPGVSELLTLAARCREQGIHVSLVPQPYELYLSKPTFLDLDGLPVLRLQEAAASPMFLGCKRVMDLAVGAVLAVLAIPVLFPSALFLRWKKGRVFRWETRCGRYGRRFSMLRLDVDRDADDLSGLERILQQLSITELPQIWNVLRGDMSLVGPRPESPDRVQRYTDWQQQRLILIPGITGLAQVQGLREQHSSEEKTRFDLQYLLNASLLTDLSLLLQTIWTLIMRLLRYPQLKVGHPTVTGWETINEASSLAQQGVLKRAHRSQSGAD
jgi:lipopolysaccharide/colanic/teichoic acid biosynthesis glycosyltransferase